jgi:sarcosine oxidase
MRPYDVAIVGLGAIGSASAWQVARRGRRLVGFDKFHPPHTMGSSTGKTRIIREAYWESPFYVPIVRRAYELWDELEMRSGKHLLTRTGGLVLGDPGGPLVSGAVKSSRAHDVPYEELTAAQVRKRYPAFRPRDGLVGIVEPRAGVLIPEDSIAAMLEQAASNTAELHYDEAVLSWKPDGEGYELRTAKGTYRAAQVILSAGAWMATELPGITLPLTVARQLLFWMEPAGGRAMFAADRFPIWLWDTDDGRAFYGFPDFGDGPKAARHHGGPDTTADTVRREIRPEEANEVLEFLKWAMPDHHGPVTSSGVCMYTNTPDEHFLIDRHPEHRGVWIASPCSGHGFKFSPAIGEALADLVEGKALRFALDPFRFRRDT